jgi:hypothetical protein
MPMIVSLRRHSVPTTGAARRMRIIVPDQRQSIRLAPKHERIADAVRSLLRRLDPPNSERELIGFPPVEGCSIQRKQVLELVVNIIRCILSARDNMM